MKKLLLTLTAMMFAVTGALALTAIPVVSSTQYTLSFDVQATPNTTSDAAIAQVYAKAFAGNNNSYIGLTDPDNVDTGADYFPELINVMSGNNENLNNYTGTPVGGLTSVTQILFVFANTQPGTYEISNLKLAYDADQDAFANAKFGKVTSASVVGTGNVKVGEDGKTLTITVPDGTTIGTGWGGAAQIFVELGTESTGDDTPVTPTKITPTVASYVATCQPTYSEGTLTLPIEISAADDAGFTMEQINGSVINVKASVDASELTPTANPNVTVTGNKATKTVTYSVKEGDKVTYSVEMVSGDNNVVAGAAVTVITNATFEVPAATVTYPTAMYAYGPFKSESWEIYQASNTDAANGVYTFTFAGDGFLLSTEAGFLFTTVDEQGAANWSPKVGVQGDVKLSMAENETTDEIDVFVGGNAANITASNAMNITEMVLDLKNEKLTVTGTPSSYVYQINSWGIVGDATFFGGAGWTGNGAQEYELEQDNTQQNIWTVTVANFEVTSEIQGTTFNYKARANKEWTVSVPEGQTNAQGNFPTDEGIYNVHFTLDTSAGSLSCGFEKVSPTLALETNNIGNILQTVFSIAYNDAGQTYEQDYHLNAQIYVAKYDADATEQAWEPFGDPIDRKVLLGNDNHGTQRSIDVAISKTVREVGTYTFKVVGTYPYGGEGENPISIVATEAQMIKIETEDLPQYKIDADVSNCGSVSLTTTLDFSEEINNANDDDIDGYENTLDVVVGFYAIPITTNDEGAEVEGEPIVLGVDILAIDASAVTGKIADVPVHGTYSIDPGTYKFGAAWKYGEVEVNVKTDDAYVVTKCGEMAFRYNVTGWNDNGNNLTEWQRSQYDYENGIYYWDLESTPLSLVENNEFIFSIVNDGVTAPNDNFYGQSYAAAANETDVNACGTYNIAEGERHFVVSAPIEVYAMELDVTNRNMTFYGKPEVVAEIGIKPFNPDSYSAATISSNLVAGANTYEDHFEAAIVDATCEFFYATYDANKTSDDSYLESDWTLIDGEVEYDELLSGYASTTFTAETAGSYVFKAVWTLADKVTTPEVENIAKYDFLEAPEVEVATEATPNLLKVAVKSTITTTNFPSLDDGIKTNLIAALNAATCAMSYTDATGSTVEVDAADVDINLASVNTGVISASADITVTAAGDYTLNVVWNIAGEEIEDSVTFTATQPQTPKAIMAIKAEGSETAVEYEGTLASAEGGYTATWTVGEAGIPDMIASGSTILFSITDQAGNKYFLSVGEADATITVDTEDINGIALTAQPVQVHATPFKVSDCNLWISGNVVITVTQSAPLNYTLSLSIDGGVSPTAVEETSEVSVYAVNGRIYVDADEYQIINMIGQDVTAANGNLSGYYVVKVDGNVVKIKVD